MTFETIMLAALTTTMLYQAIKIRQLTSACEELDNVVFELVEAHNKLVTALTTDEADS